MTDDEELMFVDTYHVEKLEDLKPPECPDCKEKMAFVGNINGAAVFKCEKDNVSCRRMSGTA